MTKAEKVAYLRGMGEGLTIGRAIHNRQNERDWDEAQGYILEPLPYLQTWAGVFGEIRRLMQKVEAGE